MVGASEDQIWDLIEIGKFKGWVNGLKSLSRTICEQFLPSGRALYPSERCHPIKKYQGYECDVYVGGTSKNDLIPHITAVDCVLTPVYHSQHLSAAASLGGIDPHVPSFCATDPSQNLKHRWPCSPAALSLGPLHIKNTLKDCAVWEMPCLSLGHVKVSQILMLAYFFPLPTQHPIHHTTWQLQL